MMRPTMPNRLRLLCWVVNVLGNLANLKHWSIPLEICFSLPSMKYTWGRDYFLRLVYSMYNCKWMFMIPILQLKLEDFHIKWKFLRPLKPQLLFCFFAMSSFQPPIENWRCHKWLEHDFFKSMLLAEARRSLFWRHGICNVPQAFESTPWGRCEASKHSLGASRGSFARASLGPSTPQMHKKSSKQLKQSNKNGKHLLCPGHAKTNGNRMQAVNHSFCATPTILSETLEGTNY